MRVKTPLLLQSENTDCSAVALAIVLKYYGCDASLPELKRQMGIARDGASAEVIACTSSLYGMKASIQRGPLEHPGTLAYPIIVFWNDRHFVVLEGFKKDKVYINDPAHGPRVIEQATFQQHFSNLAIKFQLTNQFKPHKERQQLLQFYPSLKTKYTSILFVFFTTILLTLSNLITPIFSKIYIDDYLTNTTTHSLAVPATVLFLMLLVQCFFTYTQRNILRRLECTIALQHAGKLIHKIVQLPVIFFAHRKLGELVSVLQANERLSEALVGPVWMAFTCTIQIIIYAAVLFYYSLPLSLIACSICTLHLIYFFLTKEKRRRLTSSTRHELMNVTSMTLNHLSMISQLKAMGNQNDFFSRWQGQLIRYLMAYQQLSFMNACAPAIALFTLSLANGVLLIAGITLVQNGALTVGTLIGFNTLFLSFNEALLQFLNVSGKFSGIQADYQKTAELINQTTENEPAPSVHCAGMPTSLIAPAPRGKIELIDVTFGYSNREKPLFDGFNMTIDAESRVALVGASGSGKSTLAKLMTGIYKPWSGLILIDGRSLTEISPDERSMLISMVNQEQFFFKGSIQDNLNLWSTSHTPKQMMQAAQTACIDEFIMQSGEGLAFQLMEGASNLSGGQRQRLEIARTLLHNPFILVLDEAMSALDAITESHIEKNLRKNPCTLITIAHRFNTVFDADTIFILKHGKLVDSGSHQSLMARNSVAYIELFKAHAALKETYES